MPQLQTYMVVVEPKRRFNGMFNAGVMLVESTSSKAALSCAAAMNPYWFAGKRDGEMKKARAYQASAILNTTIVIS